MLTILHVGVDKVFKNLYNFKDVRRNDDNRVEVIYLNPGNKFIR